VANLSRIRSKADFIGTLNPKAWDAVNPQTPFVFSNAHVELLVADAVKSVAAAITDKSLAREVMALSKTMAKQAGAALTSSWEPGDDLCPPWPWPWPGPYPWFDLVDPDPHPWQPIRAAEQLDLAYLLTNLAGLTAIKEHNATLKSLGTKLARVAIATMADEFESCATAPRQPFSRPARK